MYYPLFKSSEQGGACGRTLRPGGPVELASIDVFFIISKALKER
jgi:hypothetical protein